MRVVVDTSVWSLALRRRNPKPAAETEALAELISEGRVVLLGAIRQEILSGVRYSEQFDRLRLALEPFPDEPVGASDYVDAAKVCNDCLRSGVLTGNTDCLIASVAINRGLEVLTTDKDFVHMSGIVPVRLH
jgi:predicted nucleic acid-binding protein